MERLLEGEGTNELIAAGVWRLPLASDTLPPFDHTNTYLIANRGVGVLVDPGSPGTARALPGVLKQAGVSLLKAVLLTHTHSDHTAGTRAVQETHDLPIYVHPLEMGRLDDLGRVQALNDQRVLTVGDMVVRALHTPGHSPGHLSFHVPEAGIVLAGDLLAGKGSSWIGLPEGDVTQYLASLDRLETLKLEHIGPGHGPIIDKPIEKLNEAKTHRLIREQQVLKALKGASLTLTQLREQVYPELHELLTDLADRSLLAHLKKLMNEMKVLHMGRDEQGPYAARK